MKNITSTLGFSVKDVVKFVGQAFKSLFVSDNNRDFRRLKNYIAS